MSTEAEMWLKYIVIPSEVLFNENLRPVDLKVFALIDFLDGPNHCFARNEFLGVCLNVNPNTISRSISRLVKEGYLRSTRARKGNRVLQVINYKEKHKGLVEKRFVEIQKFKEQLQKEDDQMVNYDLLDDQMGFLKIPNGNFKLDQMVYHNRNNIIKDYNTSSKEEDTQQAELGEGLNEIVRDIVIPKSVESIIDYWNGSGLRKHTNTNTKTFINMVKDIKSLLSGTYYNKKPRYKEYKNIAFTEEQVFLTIDNLATAATDTSYKPFEGSYKDYLKKVGFSNFLHNPRSSGKEDLDSSLFLKYLDKPPELIVSKNRARDLHPEYTKALQHFYVEEVLGNIEPDWTYPEQIAFIEGGKKVYNFFEKNKDKIKQFYFVNSPLEQCRMTWESLKIKNYDISKITPGYFNIDKLFSIYLPAYLNDQGII